VTVTAKPEQAQELKCFNQIPSKTLLKKDTKSLKKELLTNFRTS